MRNRSRGIALPLVLLALVLIGTLVASGFAVAQLEQRIGRNTLYTVQASAAAEMGAVSVVGEWSSHGLGLLAPGDSRTLPPVDLPDRTTYEATVRRLNESLFTVTVIGTRHDAGGGTLARRDESLTLRQADSALPGAAPTVPLANRAWTSLAP
jgi:Tfp pilus assembly protein PilX